MFNTPITYVIFNRPNHTQQTFAAIRACQPRKLFIIADGPRHGSSTDVERCCAVRKIVEEIDWPCEVHRNYADENMGLKRRVSSGLDWVFGQVDRTIVLEDDCLPHADFFIFCEMMLEKYENNEQIWVITGNNFQNGHRRGKATYYFSKYPHCWGWASWKRSWQHYQGDLPFWHEWKLSKDWRLKVPERIERNYWFNIFDKIKSNKFDSWAYPWIACVWYHGGLTVTPNVNLVSNIGFGPEGTHTILSEPAGNIAVQPLEHLIHPAQIVQNTRADKYVFDHVFGGYEQRISTRILRFPMRVMRKITRSIKNSFVGGISG